MGVTISTKKENLHKIFDKVNRVYYFPDATKPLAEQTGGIEFPVLNGGVTFDTGAANKNDVELTDGVLWASKATKGDSNIAFQVSSVHDTINDLLMEKKTSEAVSVEFEGKTYTGNGYGLGVKKVTGALLMESEDKTTLVYLPNVEMYASFNGEGGDDSTGYYNVLVTPMPDSTGASFYPLSLEGSSSSN